MAEARPSNTEQVTSRDQLAELPNEDLAREYQAIIAYVVYSQALKGAELMSIAERVQEHAGQEAPAAPRLTWRSGRPRMSFFMGG